MSAGRTALLAGILEPRRVAGAKHEQAAYENFCAQHALTPSTHAVTLYLTSLLDSGRLHGRGLRNRLYLLDVHAKLAGTNLPSGDPELRRYLRGLHREAPLALPQKGTQPLHVELLHTLLDNIASPTPLQLRNAALLLFANATGLPALVLSDLRWDNVRFRRGSFEVTVPPMPSRGIRPYSPLTVLAASGGCCPREALLRWRREAGPAQQPLFSLNGKSCDVGGVRLVVAALGPPPARTDIARRRVQGPQLARLVDRTLAPQPPALRDRALLLLAFTAALRTDEVCHLLQADIVSTDRGLRLRLPRRGELWTGVPASRHGAPCPAASWRAWQQVLLERSPSDDHTPAFCQISGLVVRSEPLQEEGLNRIVQRNCAAAGLSGEWSFTSLRAGFIRTAIRAGAPEHVIGRQAGLTALESVGRHANREQLVRRNAAGQVGL